LKDIMTIRSTILTTFESVGREQEKSLAALSDDLPLLESGLDSLCIAIIVARLEDSLGLSPFDTEEEIQFPVTVGDFVAFYETAAASENAP
jgi:acyl carrier protein